MSLLTKYDEDIRAQNLVDDPVQRQLLVPLDTLVQDLATPRRRWFHWGKTATIQGFYLYGPVGVGKTFLMDMLFEAVTIPEKKRFHFHHFMQQIDAQLRRLQGQKNPLKRIAAELATSTRLLCFDEFMVEDVAYAMILAELLSALFAKGVVLVATSNIPPDELYRQGPHRDRFLPAITAIKSHCQVFNLGNQRDYRLGRASLVNTYLFPLGDTTRNQLASQFNKMAPDGQSGVLLTVQNREIVCVKYTDHVVWFEFKVICNLPRSSLDYLEIADRFDTIFVSDIPVLGEKDTVFAILLVHFIDVMYDRGIRLILSAAVPIDELYTEGEMSHDFKRTSSRLQEMQSADYLRRHPRRAVPNLLTSLE